jgi:hypothetical protein
MKRLALVLPLLLAVTACGGSDPTSSSGLSKADYLAKAEALCTKANADIKALPFPSGVAGFSDFAAKIVTIADDATSALKALDPPAADKADLDAKVLTPLSQQVEAGRAYAAKIKTAVDANDQKALGALVADPPTEGKADLAWMRTYGFKACVDTAETDE